MPKKFLYILLLIILVVVALCFFRKKSDQVSLPVDYKNGTYLVEGKSVTLVNGRAEEMIAGSASKITTAYFGNEATGDINRDGRPDVVFLITQNGGGSGTFYYVVAALKEGFGYKGTNAVFLGDRIAPQTTEIENGGIIVNYAERKPDDSMSASPSVGVSKYLEVINGQLEWVRSVE